MSPVREDSKTSIHVAVGRIQLDLPGCHGLKEKRKVIKPVTARIRDRFGVSAAEVGLNDLWQSAVIAVAAVGTDASQLDGLLHDVVRFVQRSVDGVVVDFGVEVLCVGEIHGAPPARDGSDVDAAGIERAWLEEEP